MTPLTVRFTGLEIDPARLRDRCIKGVIPAEWQRYRFAVPEDATYPVNAVNRWLGSNVEGRWASYCQFNDNRREMVLAFEHDFDAVTFVIADGKTQAFRES
jgi:hypothetical protein